MAGGGGAGALNCCKTFCCIFLVFINVISIIVGLLIAIVGFLLLWGSAVIQSLVGIASGMGEDVATNQTANGVFGSQVSLTNYFTGLATLSGCAAGLLIGFGVLMVVVSCIGCFGACLSVPACLLIYMICVALLAMGQVVVIVIWFANSSIFKTGIRGSLENQVQRYRGIGSDNFDSTTLNVIQALFGCCGLVNGTDFYQLNTGWNRTHSILGKDNRTVVFNLTYPVSCCKYNLNKYELVDPYCPYNGSANPAVSNFRTGCYDKIWQVVETEWQLNRLFYALCGLLGLEVLLIIGAVLIWQAKRKEQQIMEGGHVSVEYKMVQQKA